MENTTTKFSLGFRLLARVEGRRWLSKVRRNTPNAAVTHHSSASRKQPAPQTSISQSQVNGDTAFHVSAKEDKTTTTIMDAVMLQSTSKDTLPQEQPIQGTHNSVITDDSDTHPLQDDCEQQEKGKSVEIVKNINEKGSEHRNHIQEEIKDVGQGKNMECGNQRSRKSSRHIVSDQLDDYHYEDGIKRKSPNKECCSAETQSRKAQRREILLARLRARIEKSEARFRYVEDEKAIIAWH